MHCVRIGTSVDSETIGSYPPSGLANRVRCFPHISCSKSIHEPSLTTRRFKLSLNYVLKLKSLPENPAYSCVFEPENTKLFEESESKVPPLGIRILPHLEKSKLNLNLVDDAPSLDIVPWKLSVPAVRFDLASFEKDTTNPEIYKQLYLQLISEYPLSENIFTDGSKTEEGVAAAAVSTKRILKKLSHVGFQTTVQYISIYSRVEGYSFSSQTCLLFQRKKSFLILSDSLSSLQSILNLKYDHPVLVQILELNTDMTREGREIVFS